MNNWVGVNLSEVDVSDIVGLTRFPKPALVSLFLVFVLFLLLLLVLMPLLSILPLPHFYLLN